MDDDAWDFGVAGSVPNINAGLSDIWTVGISNDESRANSLVGGPGVSEYPPDDVEPGIFALTRGSTGALMMTTCLTNEHVDFAEEDFVGGSQGDVIANLEDGSSQYGALWAPNSYSYLAANPDAQEFCNGEKGDVTIYGGLMVRSEWSEANPELTAKVLATYLRGAATMMNWDYRDDVLDMSEKFYESVDVSISRKDMERDLLTRPQFNLDSQLSLMSRNFANGNKSTVDEVYEGLAEFLVGIGGLEEALPSSEYIKDKYLKMISSDEELRSWTYDGSAALAGGSVCPRFSLCPKSMV